MIKNYLFIDFFTRICLVQHTNRANALGGVRYNL